MEMNVEREKNKLVSIIAPFYNESHGVDHFYQSITSKLDKIKNFNFEIVCVDDGSSDDTLKKLVALVDIDARFRIIELSRNFGKEAALTAGLDVANGDAVVPMDADLQDPPELISVLIDEWQKGYDVVLARRVDRSSDTFIKRKMAELFYRVHNHLSDVMIPENVGDFRLMDRKVVDVIRQLPETRRFMKGIFAWVGFRSVVVGYNREQRVTGISKFNGWKLWNFALEGITSFSSAPLQIWMYAGVIIAILALIYALVVLVKTLVFGIVLPGYASLIVSIMFLGGVQLIGIGVLGEYIARIYMEVKRRPVYIIRRVYSETSNYIG